ncbi:MAG: 1-deoxy-D-xylulose-5-phosphate synthase [Clostridia bacterium]|nr:1-deoxy-D-xylulose-5-phosphate synthase [Clostridia bacterium]
MEPGRLLGRIGNPQDIRALSLPEREELAEEIRETIIRTVSRNGGHLASNLGVVELTIALLGAFNLDHDQIVWDVGHQSYTYKLLTGRVDRFETLRTESGISGFPKREESRYDAFNTGHSSTSISAALGILRAKQLLGEPGRVVAVIGDGALTGGMAFEALNDAGQFSERLIVILNDNQMSINVNRGGVARHLRDIRLSRTYLRVKSRVEVILNRIPLIGRPIARAIEFSKGILRRIARPYPVIFEDIGFRYFGPVDGHDLDALEGNLEAIKALDGPVLLHVCTQKGKGYAFAEESPEIYHGVAPFEIQKGVNGAAGAPADPSGAQSYSDAFGQALIEIAAGQKRLVAITAAMCSGTGLTGFASRFPDRFFDVCIAEQHAVTMACGMASRGIVPVVAIYSTFLQRAFDQVLHDAALQRLHVIFAVDRAGISGEDGETHQGVYDLAYLMPVPGLEILAPRDYGELRRMLRYAVDQCEGPVCIRYPRGAERRFPGCADLPPLPVGKAQILRPGGDISIVSCGVMARNAILAAQKLDEEGISCEVIDIRRVKPLDLDTVLESVCRTGRLVTLEDGTESGGFGMTLTARISRLCPALPSAVIATGDHPITQGSISQIMAREGMDPDSIARICRSLIRKTM